MPRTTDSKKAKKATPNSKTKKTATKTKKTATKTKKKAPVSKTKKKAVVKKAEDEYVPPEFKKLAKREMMDLAKRVVGEASVLVSEYLYKKKDISEFEISKKLKIEVNDARSILYKLFNYNLVTYIRRKDRVKGWYISYWTLNPKGFVELKAKRLKQRLKNMKDRLIREEKNPNGFFLCKNACMRVDFDAATEYGYRCPECGELLNPQDNSKTIQNLKERIKELEMLQA